jgi:hypothetical protein
LDGVICSEIVNFFIHFSDNFQIHGEKLELNVNVQVVGNLAQSISDEYHLIFLHPVFEIDASVMLYEKTNFRFIVNTFHIDLGSYQFGRIDFFLFFVFITPILKK